MAENKTPKHLVGANIKNCREEADLSQDELAAKSGLAQKYISMIENDKARITLDAAISLANAMDIGLDKLCYGQLKNTDDYYTKETSRYRKKMNDRQKKVMDHLGVRVVAEILTMPDL